MHAMYMKYVGELRKVWELREVADNSQCAKCAKCAKYANCLHLIFLIVLPNLQIISWSSFLDPATLPSSVTSMLRTTSCHINYLPAEILREIFVLGLSDGPSPSLSKGMHAVSLVCRHWRLLALEEARFWSKISIYFCLSDVLCWSPIDYLASPLVRARLERAALYLCRSKGAPLTLTISLHGVPVYVHECVRDLVSPHYHRCNRLSLDLHDQHDVVDRAMVWLPLPHSTFDRLDQLRINVGEKGRGTLDLGLPLALRWLDISTPIAISFHSGFRITDEVKLSGLDPKTVFKVLRHCRDVKKIKISSLRTGLEPLLSSLSFPTLEELTLQAHAEMWCSFPIQNAPNLRYLDFPSLHHLSRLEGLDAGTRSGIMHVLNGLEVLVIQDSIFDARDYAFIRFESLRMLRVHWLDDDFIQLLSLAPEFPPSHNGEPPTGPAVHFSFPALQLLIIRSICHQNWCQLLLEVARARPMLNLVFGSDFCPPELDLVRGRVHFVENIWCINDNELFARFLG
ncbi:uncharacterized protein EI90DRAFT_3013338 [Cantharellus anzutake]|uniref:uncharacterized protein n=1 Tax=Cantharellus anzutake TaxID=1750568 RepID=UPI001905B723|nr:uncharacterized protein EI90DRAFT_3013338 [Cantharellus anzutake]KAF8337991.1 hypothetical protein EI90DRAFT_3013338 [Cantharellus anzutake]